MQPKAATNFDIFRKILRFLSSAWRAITSPDQQPMRLQGTLKMRRRMKGPFA
jgi:hypothetical protein